VVALDFGIVPNNGIGFGIVPNNATIANTRIQ
jgi:hypothetical protein